MTQETLQLKNHGKSRLSFNVPIVIIHRDLKIIVANYTLSRYRPKKIMEHPNPLADVFVSQTILSKAHTGSSKENSP